MRIFVQFRIFCQFLKILPLKTPTKLMKFCKMTCNKNLISWNSSIFVNFAQFQIPHYLFCERKKKMHNLLFNNDSKSTYPPHQTAFNRRSHNLQNFYTRLACLYLESSPSANNLFVHSSVGRPNTTRSSRSSVDLAVADMRQCCICILLPTCV